MMPGYKIVFMGTPQFAVPSLQALHSSHHRIIAVITQPDRPKGRGRRSAPSPVKTAALKFGYPVIQPDNLKSTDPVATIKDISPDFLIVVAYGQLLSQALIDTAAVGAINVHASLLPKYRGPAPIQWAIINREPQTGVTTIKMDAGMDTGHMLLKRESRIRSDDTSETLHDRLSVLGADLLIETLQRYLKGDIHPMPQDHALATYAPMLKKEDGHIQWHQSAAAIEAFIRGVTPWPGAYSFIDGKRFKILKSTALAEVTTETPGTVIAGFPGELRIAAGDGVISVESIQGPSGKRLDIDIFLRGMPIPPGTVFK